MNKKTRQIISKLWQHSSSTVISKSYLSQGPYLSACLFENWHMAAYAIRLSDIQDLLHRQPDFNKNAWNIQYEFILRTQNTTSIHEALCKYPTSDSMASCM